MVMNKKVSTVLTLSMLLSGAVAHAASTSGNATVSIGTKLVVMGKQYGPAGAVGAVAGYAYGKSEGFKEGVASVKPAATLSGTREATCPNGHLVQAAVMPLNPVQVGQLALLSSVLLSDDQLKEQRDGGALTPRSRAHALAIRDAYKHMPTDAKDQKESDVTKPEGVMNARGGIAHALGIKPAGVLPTVQATVDMDGIKDSVRQAIDVDSLADALAAKLKPTAAKDENKEHKAKAITETGALTYLTRLESDHKNLLVRDSLVNQKLRQLVLNLP